MGKPDPGLHVDPDGVVWLLTVDGEWLRKHDIDWRWYPFAYGPADPDGLIGFDMGDLDLEAQETPLFLRLVDRLADDRDWLYIPEGLPVEYDFLEHSLLMGDGDAPAIDLDRMAETILDDRRDRLLDPGFYMDENANMWLKSLEHRWYFSDVDAPGEWMREDCGRIEVRARDRHMRMVSRYDKEGSNE